MKPFITLIALLICQVSIIAQLSTNRNYASKSQIRKYGVTNVAQIDTLGAHSRQQEVVYYDGLGRKVQIVNVKAAANGNDIVTPLEYDVFGREVKTFLPYAAAGTAFGSLRLDAVTEQQFYYSTANSSSDAPKDAAPFSQKFIELTPLERVRETGAAGATWGIGAGHTIETKYAINAANEVRLWNIQNNGTVNTGAASPGYYTAGALYKNVLFDEHQNRVVEYKDKEGRLVCKKVQDGGTTASPTYMITQYIYDDFGQLAYVVPAALENIISFTETDANFTHYIYAYHYDGRGRLIEKKIPGKGWEYTVYNAADRPVYSSNQEQRTRGVWGFIKYDALGRVIITGEATNTPDRAALQATVNSTLQPTGNVALYETYNGSTAGSGMGYSNTTLPNSNFEIFTAHYYDDYNILTTTLNPFATWFTQPNGTTESQRTKSLPTVTATRVLGSATLHYAATYYDEKARACKIVQQHQLNGVDITSYTYNFVGEVTASTRQHYKDGALALTASNTYQYDHAGRKTQTSETINSQAAVNTTYTYYAIGWLATQTAGGQTTNYKYNTRGWVKEQSSALFTQQLKYDDASGSYAQYNGNIGQQLWTTNGQGHSYNYSYDKANRLLSGISDESYNETMSYDKMGNIQTLTRQGTTGMPGLGTLAYSYNGNQLQSVSGGYSRSYTYDTNGSMTGDGTLSIQYNELNLPKQVTGTPAGAVTYTYGADGRKLAKQTTSETRQYVGGIEYIATTIDLLHTEAGIARNNNGTYTYEFFLTDHLGNARIVYNSAGTVLQQQDYMPFGLDIARYQATPNRYKYNGKEKQDELTQYDFGARFYDPVIGRWHVVDPLADKTLDPYGFTYNNPVNLIDPTGMEPTDWYATRNKEGSFSMAWFDATSASLIWNNQLYLNVGNDRADEVGAMLNASNVLSGFENRVERATSDNLVSRSFQEYPALPVSGNTATISATPPISGGIIGEVFHAARNSYLSYKGTTKGATNIEFLKVALTGVIGEAVIGLAASKTGGRAFFSGAGTEARAIEQGYQTLGQTRAGRNLQNLIDSKNIPWSQAEPMWQRLSATWAKGIPNGSSVPVFLNNPRAGSVWFQTELPILQSKGVNLIYK